MWALCVMGWALGPLLYWVVYGWAHQKGRSIWALLKSLDLGFCAHEWVRIIILIRVNYILQCEISELVVEQLFITIMK